MVNTKGRRRHGCPLDPRAPPVDVGEEGGLAALKMMPFSVPGQSPWSMTHTKAVLYVDQGGANFKSSGKAWGDQ